MDFLLLALPKLGTSEWAIHMLIFSVNILLFVFASSILGLLASESEAASRAKLFRFLNVLVLCLHVADLFFLKINPDHQHHFIRLGYSLMAIYAAMFLYELLCFFSKKRFGKYKEIDGDQVYLDTYRSRLFDLLFLFITIITAVIVLIKIWHANSMLEATGVLGIMAAFLAFTSSIWAPDIISGLIILNTQMLEDGDVVVIDGYPDEYVISRVGFIYVILLDVRNNHRTLMRNNRFTNSKIDNISRVASLDGLRKALRYKIGYPHIDTNIPADERAVLHRSFMHTVDRMFERANALAEANVDIKINRSRTFDWAMTSAGDYALEFTLWVYLERVPNTRVTSKIRSHLIASVYRINEAVYEASIAENLSLATPDLMQATITQQAHVGSKMPS